jgi:hypothetical protein
MFDNYVREICCFIQILGNQTKPTIKAKKLETKTKFGVVASFHGNRHEMNVMDEMNSLIDITLNLLAS